jgi:hypothetical protein
VTAADNATVKPERGKTRMTVEQANEEAMALMKRMAKAFFQLSQSQQAKKIGCHWKTWTKTALFKKAKKEGRIKPHRVRRGGATPKAVSLSSELEATKGKRDEVLHGLINDQISEDKSNKVHSRGRV